MRYLLFIVMMFSLPAVAAKLYKTLDQDGKVVYTDTPPAGAEEIKLPPANITPSFSLPKLNLDMDTPASTNYKRLEVTSPVNNSTVFINESNLSIKVNSIPVVNTSEGHTLQLLVDNKVISTGPTNSMLLDKIDRGTHTVKARIINDDGKVIISSAPVVVHIRQNIQSTSKQPRAVTQTRPKTKRSY